MKISEIINEADQGSSTNWNEIFKQIDAKRAAGIPIKYPVIGGVERSPEVIQQEILRGNTLETEPLDHEHFQKWQQQQKEKLRAPNFLGISDMLKADELKHQKDAAVKAPAVTAPKSTTLSRPMKGRGGGGGANLDREDLSGWRAPIEDTFQTSFDPKRISDQLRYERLKRGY